MTIEYQLIRFKRIGWTFYGSPRGWYMVFRDLGGSDIWYLLEREN